QPGNFVERFQDRLNIVRGIQWQGRMVLAVSAPPGSVRVFILQVRGIRKQDVTKLNGGRIGGDRPAISVSEQTRQVTRMVEVGVRQQAPIERGRFFRKRVPVPKTELLQALEKAAIHQ